MRERIKMKLIVLSVSIFASWFALAGEIIKNETTPTDELKRLQGAWKVTGLFWSAGEGGRLPDQLGLNDRGSEVVIEGNRLTLGGQTRATLANDLSLPAQQKEIGFVGSNLIMLTLPDGKGILCSYLFKGDKVQIAYPHTCFCRRGSGQVIDLERSAD